MISERVFDINGVRLLETFSKSDPYLFKTSDVRSSTFSDSGLMFLMAMKVTHQKSFYFHLLMAPFDFRAFLPANSIKTIIAEFSWRSLVPVASVPLLNCRYCFC